MRHTAIMYIIRLTSELQCFCKSLERIMRMCNCLYTFFKEELFYKKQFGFQTNYSTCRETFSYGGPSMKENEFRLGEFVYVYKAFDTFDHFTSLKKNYILLV